MLNAFLNFMNPPKEKLTPQLAQEKLGSELLEYAKNGDFLAIQQLLKQQPALVNYADKTSGQTALMISAANGHYKTVKVLLEAGANKDLRDRIGFTAYELASLCKNGRGNNKTKLCLV